MSELENLKQEVIDQVSYLPNYNNNRILVDTAVMIAIEKGLNEPTEAIKEIFNMGVKHGRRLEKLEAQKEFNQLLNHKEAA